MTATIPYVIDTPDKTDGPWRVTDGGKYATVTMADGRKLFLGVEKEKRVRIRYKPRGTFGWRWYGFVRESGTAKVLAGDSVTGSIGVRGLLKMAGLL